jgi:hypothetical protein
MPTQTFENIGVIKNFSLHTSDVDSTFGFCHRMEISNVSALFLRISSQYGENAFVLYRQLVSQTYRREVEAVAQSEGSDWYTKNI